LLALALSVTNEAQIVVKKIVTNAKRTHISFQSITKTGLYHATLGELLPISKQTHVLHAWIVRELDLNGSKFRTKVYIIDNI